MLGIGAWSPLRVLPACLFTGLTAPIAWADNELSGSVLALSSAPNHGMAYSEQEIIDAVRLYVDSEIATELEMWLDDDDNDLFEIWQTSPKNKPGQSDANTIGLNTVTPEGKVQMPLWLAAFVCVHELEHAKRPRPPGVKRDPLT